MQTQRWTRWGLSTNCSWPTAGHSASRRRSSLKAVVSSTAIVNRPMDRAAMPGVSTQKESQHDR
jgi:hypothetical protein